ncbi:MAG: hypothetical protein MZV70_44720 [Desulfobacterales bacterium]|nr:hypothetical protein [Desulfobacterales bacterium]
MAARDAGRPARNTLTPRRSSSRRRSTSPRRTPRIGVFVCNCGINIGGVVDVPGSAGVCRDAAARGLRRTEPVHLQPGLPGADEGR